MKRVQSANIQIQKHRNQKNFSIKTDISPIVKNKQKFGNSLQTSTLNNQNATTKSTYNTNRYSAKNRSLVSQNIPTNNTSAFYQNNESQKSIPQQNQEHVYFLSERPTTANSYKFLFLTESDANSAKFIKQQEQEKKNLKINTFKKKTESDKLKQEIRQVNNIISQNNDISQMSSAQRLGYSKNKKQQSVIEQQWNYFLELKNNITDTYKNDFQDYVTKQQVQGSQSNRYKDKEILEVQQAREEKFRILRQEYKQNMKAQKIQMHNYLHEKPVEQQLINNYKNILHPQSCKVINQKPSYSKNKKEFQINSQVHRKLNLPGYRENKVAAKSTNKVKIKQFLHNFMQGEQKYFEKLKNIQHGGKQITLETLKLKDKFYTDHMYEPKQQFQTAQDLQLGSKDCKLLQEQAQIKTDLKEFNQNINYQTDQIEIEPKSPINFIKRNLNQSKASVLQRQQTRYSEHQKQGIIDNGQKLTNKIRMSYLGSLSNNQNAKNEQLNMIKAFMQKHKQFSQKYLILSEDIEDQQNSLDDKIDREYFNEQLGQMVIKSEDILDIINGKKQIFKQNPHLTDIQKDFFFNVKNNNIDEASIQLYFNKDLINIKNTLGQTPLHFAAKRGYEEMVELLLKNGAGITTKDSRLRSAKDVCLMAQGKKCKIYLNLDRLEGDLLQKRGQILESAMIDLNRLNKWVQHSKQNTDRNNLESQMNGSYYDSQSSGSDFEDFIEQPLREKLMEQYQSQN